MFVLKWCRQFQSALSHKGYTLRTKRREDNDLKLRNEIDGNDVFYDNSPEKGLKKMIACLIVTPKQLVSQEKNPRILYFVFLWIKEEVIFMLTKRGAYLLTRTTSIEYTHKTVKHNTFRFSTVGYITI